MIESIYILLGVFSAAFGIKGFLLSSHFIDGGVTGVSMLLSQITGYPIALLLPTVNIPFVFVAYRQLGAKFALKSCLAIAALALVLAFVPFPDVTPDPMLTAVFGGLFIGAGIALAIRGGAVLDGSEVAALLISKQSSLFRLGDVILIFNICLFCLAMFFIGMEEALYSILTYAAAARTLNFVLYGLDEFTAITVISDSADEIRKRLISDLGRGVTMFAAEGGMSGAPQKVLYSVITRLEIGTAKRIINEVDKNAFIVVQSVGDVEGGAIGKVPLH